MLVVGCNWPRLFNWRTGGVEGREMGQEGVGGWRVSDARKPQHSRVVKSR